MLNMISLMLISLPVGFLGALTGLGGASILVPILVLLGIPVKEAIASCMVTIIATSSGSASSYVKEGIANVKVAMYLEMYTTVGAMLGAIITSIIAPVYLYFFFAGFLATSFLRLKGGIQEHYVSPEHQDRASQWLELQGSYFDEASQETVVYRVTNALRGGLGMFIAGLAAGMLGIGAGAFKVTVQESILKLPPKVSSTTSNFIIGMTALAGTSIYFVSGLLNVTLMGPLTIGATLGAVAGGRTLNRLGDRNLKVLFYVIITFLIFQMLYKGVTSL
jgi:uncharacterized membrane protein YfcA